MGMTQLHPWAHASSVLESRLYALNQDGRMHHVQDLQFERSDAQHRLVTSGAWETSSVSELLTPDESDWPAKLVTPSVLQRLMTHVTSAELHRLAMLGESERSATLVPSDESDLLDMLATSGESD
jgi:hypothetical protein